MLGFDVDVSPRETSPTEKARPIYLDMQVTYNDNIRHPLLI